MAYTLHGRVKKRLDGTHPHEWCELECDSVCETVAISQNLYSNQGPEDIVVLSLEQARNLISDIASFLYEMSGDDGDEDEA